jgi:peptidoglycan-associated lipoprotein
MKCTKFTNLTAATLLLVVVTVGCKKTPQNTTPLLGRGQGPVGDERSRPIGDTAKIDDGSSTGIPNPGNLKDYPVAAEQPAALRDNTVYFDYDRANVRASETSKLDAVASYIKGGANRPIRIEGHCDERGTEEYNRSLGERRALAVREYLARAGVDPNMIDTISHGEDKPAVPGHDQAAWAKNRRAEFLLLQAPTGVGATGPQ